MIQDQRILHNLTDVSVQLNDYRTASYVFPYETGEFLYIGNVCPFNNLFFEMKVPNTVSTFPLIEIWWGNEWIDAVDLVDETNSLQNSGRITWNTPYDRSWEKEDKSFDIPQLVGTEIYYKYWMRISFGANLDPLTEINYVGQKFSNDTIFKSFYPDLMQTNILESFLTGKTSWDEQHYMAAEHIVRDLIKNGIVQNRTQLLDWSLFIDASCHKVAEIIYTAFGLPYFDQKKTAQENYGKCLNLKYFKTDFSKDGRIDPIDRAIQNNFMTR